MKHGPLWLLVFSQILFCSQLRSQALSAVDDAVSTLPNAPVVIAVLTNDLIVTSNQTAILRVTQPLHGKVIINSGSMTNAELSRLFQFAAIQLSNNVVRLTRPVSWNVLATNIAGTGSVFSITNTNIVSQRFYRVGMHF